MVGGVPFGSFPMTLLAITLVDAETDLPLSLLEDGRRPSLLILPVIAPPPSGDAAVQAVNSLLADPANGPIGPGDPPDKPVVGTSDFPAAFFAQLAGQPRIVRIDPPPAGPIDLGIPADGQGGWWVALVPPGTDIWEFSSTLLFVEAATDFEEWAITAFRRDLSALGREVLEMRAAAKAEIAIQAPSWGGSETQVPGAVWDMVHAYLENSFPPKDPRLAGFWINDLSWAVLDFAIPAREFDLLVERYTRVRTILADVPFPEIPGFERCAYGIPVTLSKEGFPLTILNPRLFVPSFSGYFPRKDHQIKTDLGLLWLANLQAIFECVVARLQKKMEEAEKTRKFWQVTSLIVPLLILPTPATFLSVITDAAAMTFLQNANPYLLQAIGLAQGAVLSLLGGGVSVPGIEGLSGKAFEKGVDVLKGLVAAQGIEALQAVAKDAAALQALVTNMSGVSSIPPELAPFIAWCLRVGVLDVLLAALFGAIAADDPNAVSPQGAFTVPLVGSAQTAGIPISPSLAALVNGEDPDFPAAVPSSSTTANVIAGGSTIGLFGLAGYLAFR